MRLCCDCNKKIGPHRYRCDDCSVTGKPKPAPVRRCRDCNKVLPATPRAQRCPKHRAARARAMLVRWKERQKVAKKGTPAP